MRPRACCVHLLFVVFVTLLARTGRVAAEPLEILVEDDAAPWSLKDGTGYANDVVCAAFKASGVDAKLHVMPYARCRNMTVNGEAVACFSMSWVPELRGKIVFADKPLFNCYSDYFYKVGKPLGAESEGEIKRKLVVGTVVGYEYPPSFYQLRDKGMVVAEESPSEELNFKKLADGRIDAAMFTYNETKPAEIVMARAGVSGKVACGFRSGVLGSYIGFSTKHPRGAWALQKFNEGFRIIEANGVLQKIDQQWKEKARLETEALLHTANGSGSKAAS
jgi:polar amino acid transport system substrate-binding protein